MNKNSQTTPYFQTNWLWMKKIVAIGCLLIAFNPILFGQSKNSVFNPRVSWVTLEQALQMDPDEVRHLKLTRKNAQDFPKNITQFSNLESLSLQGMKLSNIPEEITAFKFLSFLDLSKNNLESLPDSLCDLAFMEVLVLNRNPLMYVPHCLGRMKHLKAIDLYDTEVSNLPESLEEVQTLKLVDFQGVQLRAEEIQSLKTRFPSITFFFDPPCNCFR